MRNTDLVDAVVAFVAAAAPHGDTGQADTLVSGAPSVWLDAAEFEQAVGET